MTTRRASTTLKSPQKPNWLIFYFRGICYERSKQWQSAEADFKRALELSPDQAHCAELSRLFVDRSRASISTRACDDPPRRSSSGRTTATSWIRSAGLYYRIHNYDEAVKHLERASN
jgi:tetratricopeptide (TPR) repeat protein